METHLSRSGHRACYRCGDDDPQHVARRQARAEKHGMAWVAGAFVICPCHLPLTLWAAASLLAGTAGGAVLSSHPFVAGTAITLVWSAATWHGFRLMRSA
jgi:MerE protein